jgi:deazaflavin-dependent oxidoreductase (nitroreductase family)
MNPTPTPKHPARARPAQLDSPLVPKVIHWLSRANVWLYQKTNGRIAGTWRVGSAFPRGVPVCLLTTQGRKSKLPRTTPLLFMMDGERVVLVGSQGGLPGNPQWYSNILADPHVRIQIKGRVQDMRAHVAEPAERAILWERLVAMYRDFATYQTWTTRVIPVVVCEARAQPSAAHDGVV